MTPREDIRRICAEYVIGTLDAAERQAWRVRMAEEPEVAELVALWERRFFPLHELSAPARPPEALFDRILGRLPVPAVEEAPDEPESAPTESAPVSDMEPVLEAVPEPEPAPQEGISEPEIAPPAEAAREAPLSEPVETGPVDVPIPAPVADELSQASPGAVEPIPDEVKAEVQPELTDGESQADPQETSVPEEASAPEAPAAAPSDPASDAAEDARPETSAPPVIAPPIRAVEPPVPVQDESANPWRVASGLLMLALLLGGGAFAYRELHHRTPPAVPVPPQPVEEVAVQPVPPPPAEPAPRVPESFAVLGPQPVPALGLAFDHKDGTVSVLKMAVPPRPGHHYHLWLLTEAGETHHVAQFDAPGSYPSDLLQDVDAHAFSGGLLVVTEEEDGTTPTAPTGTPIFSGMAVKH